DVTVQYCCLVGNTRSLFLKYDDTTNVSIHHTWVQKQWSRGPMVSSQVMADVRNLVVDDWTMWAVRFEKDSSGNMVNSLFTLGTYAQSLGGKANSALRLMQSGPVYTSGNVSAGLADPGQEGAATAPLPAPPVTTLPVAEMAPLVRTRAGCLPRDGVDQADIELQSGWAAPGGGGGAGLRAGAPGPGVGVLELLEAGGAAAWGGELLPQPTGGAWARRSGGGAERRAERLGGSGRAPNDPDLSNRAEWDHYI